MPSAFLDTNVIIYAATAAATAPAKAARAVELLEREDFAISAQVLQEFYATVRRPQIGLSEAQTNAWIENLMQFECASVDQALFISAIGFARRYQIPYWDAAIVAAAERLGARTLYSEDLSHGQTYGSVAVVNPFLEVC
jgi:predicted nucleic acid-binding protein